MSDKDTFAETPREGVAYIHPSIETKLSKEKRDEVHQIVQEIKNFGASQRQLLYLIYQLALNLESRSALVAITQAVNTTREQVAPVSKLVLDERSPAKRLIVVASS